MMSDFKTSAFPVFVCVCVCVAGVDLFLFFFSAIFFCATHRPLPYLPIRKFSLVSEGFSQDPSESHSAVP